MKKLNSAVATVVLASASLVGFSSNAHANEINGANAKIGGMQAQAGAIKELSHTSSTENGSTKVEASYQLNDQGDTSNFEVLDNSGQRNVKQFINGELVAEATYDKQKGTVTTVDAEGQKTVQKADDLVKVSSEIPAEDEKALSEGFEQSNAEQGFSPNSAPNAAPSAIEGKAAAAASPGFNLVKSKYNTAWNQYGYLYQKQTVQDTKHYELNVSAGTLVATIAAVVDVILTKGGLTVLLRTLLYSAAGVVIDKPIRSFSAKKYLTEIEVYSQGLLGLKSEQFIVTATVDSKYGQVHDGGDTRTYDEMLDNGVYNVVLQKL
ncbi:hypothetical protein CDO73_12185 [Saccharibacillus sp. O23]|uniref:hypothetical protein n=1 Tax=Saccharibacillus sp. O23 TaxID=2009338 RepID=UPI000B4E6553|nr:hypothetical protein [Saccharibacillus sp. O23]OWR29839.1 hypothetical protein CDO73_12185 [Saccharibacillus sp. O23]